MNAPQDTVPWAMHRIVEMLGQNADNLEDPTSDLSGSRVLAALNSEYKALSSEGMNKCHPHLMRWANVETDERGWIKDFRWHNGRGDLIGLHPRRGPDDLEPTSRERRNFASFHQMGYALSDHSNVEYDFDSGGQIRVNNSRCRHFRIWFVRYPSPLIAGRADRAYECIDFKPERVLYGWNITDESSDFTDELVAVWDKTSSQMNKEGYMVAWSLRDTVYRIRGKLGPGEFHYAHYYKMEIPMGVPPWVWRYNGKTIQQGYRFELANIANGSPVTPYPVDPMPVFGEDLPDSEYNAFRLPHLPGAMPTDGAKKNIILGPPAEEFWVNTPYVAPSGGALSWSILPWFPRRFMELLIYRAIFRFKRVSTHDRFVAEQLVMQQQFDQWIDRFDLASSPQTGVDPSTPSLTEGCQVGLQFYFRGG